MTPTQRACTQLDALRYRALGGNETACAQVVQALAGPDLFEAIAPLIRRVKACRKHLADATPHGGAHVEAELAAMDVEIAAGRFAVGKAGGVL